MAKANFKNRALHHGDNLEFLRGMNSSAAHLIATGPPFNKSRDFHATPDSLAAGAKFTERWSWEKDVHEEWVDSIKDDWPGVWKVKVRSGENNISNCLLLCAPCNGRKGSDLNLHGLAKRNKSKNVNWMKNEELALWAQARHIPGARKAKRQWATSPCRMTRQTSLGPCLDKLTGKFAKKRGNKRLKSCQVMYITP